MPFCVATLRDYEGCLGKDRASDCLCGVQLGSSRSCTHLAWLRGCQLVAHVVSMLFLPSMHSPFRGLVGTISPLGGKMSSELSTRSCLSQPLRDRADGTTWTCSKWATWEPALPFPSNRRMLVSSIALSAPWPYHMLTYNLTSSCYGLLRNRLSSSVQI